MPINRPVAFIILREIDAHRLAAPLLEFRKPCFTSEELFKSSLGIDQRLLAGFRSAVVDPGIFLLVLQLMVHELVKVHR